MEKQDIELAQAILKLTDSIQSDRIKERCVSDRKNFRQNVVIVVLIIAFAVMWMYEIHESYNYDSFEITNNASAKAEIKSND